MACFLFSLKQQRFSQMQVCVLGERVRWELTDPRMIKSCGARNAIVTFLTRKGSGNFQFLVSQHTFLKETPYGFVIDFQFFCVRNNTASLAIKSMGSFLAWYKLGVHSPETTIEFSRFSWNSLSCF